MFDLVTRTARMWGFVTSFCGRLVDDLMRLDARKQRHSKSIILLNWRFCCLFKNSLTYRKVLKTARSTSHLSLSCVVCFFVKTKQS